jgi:hypothetical protein
MKRKQLNIALLLAAAFSAPAYAATVTEFTFSEVQLVETVQCASFDLLADVTQYGHLYAGGCTSTGPLVSGTFKGGHVHVEVSMTDGTSYVMDGCRVGETAVPTYYHYTLICVP